MRERTLIGSLAGRWSASVNTGEHVCRYLLSAVESRYKMRTINKKISIKNIGLKILLLVVPLALLGCSGHYGRLAVNDDVKTQFEAYKVLPDHRYYYSGSEARPRAVIGIHEAYRLQSDLWVPVNLTSEQLKDWVDYFGPHFKNFQGSNGSDILADDGSKIGVWYTFIDWRDWAAVKMIGEKVVSITTPITHQEENPIWFRGFKTLSLE